MSFISHFHNVFYFNYGQKLDALIVPNNTNGVAIPILGLATEVRGYKVVGQEKDPGVTSHVLVSAKSARE
jgi:hypothetical protein